MFLSPLVTELVEALRILPGVGPKSAQRMALHLLERQRSGGKRLADVLVRAMEQVRECRECQSLTEQDICHICASATRDRSMLCVVENPVDVLAVESAGTYRGLYFVLKGHLSPLDGIGPKELGIPRLLERVRQGCGRWCSARRSWYLSTCCGLPRCGPGPSSRCRVRSTCRAPSRATTCSRSATGGSARSGACGIR